MQLQLQMLMMLLRSVCADLIVIIGGAGCAGIPVAEYGLVKRHLGKFKSALDVCRRRKEVVIARTCPGLNCATGRLGLTPGSS